METKETKDGITTTIKDSGHVIKIPEQGLTPKVPKKRIDVEALTEVEFRTLVLKKLGYKIKR